MGSNSSNTGLLGSCGSGHGSCSGTGGDGSCNTIVVVDSGSGGTDRGSGNT